MHSHSRKHTTRERERERERARDLSNQLASRVCAQLQLLRQASFIALRQPMSVNLFFAKFKTSLEAFHITCTKHMQALTGSCSCAVLCLCQVSMCSRINCLCIRPFSCSPSSVSKLLTIPQWEPHHRHNCTRLARHEFWIMQAGSH